ncbi:exonuclease domain-containing protein [Corynebacterium tuberculostearicum]|uniref:exonuclease domain-containing protein n=1 Tax=Corynebacterium tuberculostearicum TaxID=38304 RepID=UPI0015C9ED71|nr:exonuclease domain-containing protein [Corynebacterium tuberculostearicum]QQU82522.1 hypothetical protein I6I74_03855 [Corynebacterium tuberculostearicum]
MNFFNRLHETLTHLENALDNAAHLQAGRPVFAVIDTETTGFNKRYDRIIELAVARFDESFRLVDQWHTDLTPVWWTPDIQPSRAGRKVIYHHVQVLRTVQTRCRGPLRKQ